VANLLDELRVVGELEGLRAVWLQAEGFPDLMHGVVAEAADRSHAAGAPVGGAAGQLLEGLGQHGFDLLVADSARGSAARFVQQPSQPALDIAGAPFADRVVGEAELGGDPAAGDAVGAAQDDAGALSEAVAGLGALGPAQKFGPILLREVERSFMRTAEWHDVNLDVGAGGGHRTCRGSRLSADAASKPIPGQPYAAADGRVGLGAPPSSSHRVDCARGPWTLDYEGLTDTASEHDCNGRCDGLGRSSVRGGWRRTASLG